MQYLHFAGVEVVDHSHDLHLHVARDLPDDASDVGAYREIERVPF